MSGLRTEALSSLLVLKRTEYKSYGFTAYKGFKSYVYKDICSFEYEETHTLFCFISVGDLPKYFLNERRQSYYSLIFTYCLTEQTRDNYHAADDLL